MTSTRAAKYLTPMDTGKTITITDEGTGHDVTGQLQRIDATDCSPIELTIIAGSYSGHYLVNHDDAVTITGTDAPASLNLHRSVLDQDG